MNATTADEEAVVANGALRTRESVEPLSNFSVVRARREFDNQSTIGFIATATTRRLDVVHRFPAGAGVHRRARLGSPDEEALRGHRLPGGQLRPAATAEAIQLLQESTVHSFQRPDADHVEEDPTRTSLGGGGGLLAFQKIAGSKIRFNFNTAFKTPGLDINDVGFMRRADLRTMSNWVQGRNDTPSKYLRSFRWNLNQWGTWNYGGDRLDLGGNVNAHWVFANSWSTGIGFTQNARPFDDRATRGEGPGAYANPNWSYWNYVNSDDRKRATLSTFFNVGGDGHGSRWIGVSPGVTFRPTSFLSLNTGLDWSRNQQDAQWVENTADGHYVFGHLDQTTVSLTMRVNYTITPQLSVQIYAAPFVSAGDYDRFKELVDGRAARYEDRYAPIAYDGQSRLQLPILPHHQRAALGVQARLGAVRRLAAGTRRPARHRPIPVRSATSMACSARPRATCSWSSGATGSTSRLHSA